MNIALSVRCLDPMFGHIVLGELEDGRLRVIDRDDGVKMMCHIFSC
jgi:hypothetical protein